MTRPWPTTGPGGGRRSSPAGRRALRLLTRQAGMCPLCGDRLLSAEQPPQSPAQSEQWWLRVTRKAITAGYLAYHGMPSPPDVNGQASCTSPAVAGNRDRSHSPKRPRGLLEPRAGIDWHARFLGGPGRRAGAPALNRSDHALKVTSDGKGLVGHAGAILLRKAADQAGLSAVLSAALRKKNASPLFDRGIVLVSVAISVRSAPSMSDIALLAHLAPVLGAAPSGPTVRRALELAGAPAMLDRIARARAKARPCCSPAAGR